MKKKTIFLAVAVMLFAAFATACSSNKLTGQWEYKDGDAVYFFVYNDIDFDSDGGVYSGGAFGDWSVSSNKLTVIEDGETYTFTFKISGSTLTITDSEGDSATYSKVK